MTHFSSRLKNLKQSDIRAVTRMIKDVDGINLGQGICDLPVPTAVKRGAQEAIENDRSIYSSYTGIRRLREPILEKAQHFNRIPASSPDEVMISAGSTGAFVTAIFTLLDPGDEAILFEPFYGYHRNLIQLTGAGVSTAPVSAGDNQVDFESLVDAINPRTRVIVLNTPTNPTGKVWTREELERLLQIAQRNDLIVITDEIYEYMTYDGHEHVSLASLPGAFERTITISGFSKTYNMTGWRIGYAVGPEDLISRMGLLNDLFYICAPTPLQYGVSHAFTMSDQYFEEFQAAYDVRRRMLMETLEDVGFSFNRPEGAYYILASFERLRERMPGFEDDARACETLIRKAGVATIPGRSFFEDPQAGAHLLRFCFAKEVPVLEQACRQLREAFL
ncbi:MAG: pyridoxal phosphate-dependent aminotransferase [Bacteroidota bacterium]